MNISTKNIKFTNKERASFLKNHHNFFNQSISDKSSDDFWKVIFIRLINDIKNMIVFDLSWSEIQKIKSNRRDFGDSLDDHYDYNVYDIAYFLARKSKIRYVSKPITGDEKITLGNIDSNEIKKQTDAYFTQNEKYVLTKNFTYRKIEPLKLLRIYNKTIKEVESKIGIHKWSLPKTYKIEDEFTIREYEEIDVFSSENIYDDFKTTDIKKYFKKDYKIFTLRKKNGKIRTIESPNDRLNLMQKCINVFLQLIYKPDNCIHGFVKGRNIKTNALKHVDKKFVYNIDIKNFFPSIKSDRIIKELNSEPFGLNKDISKAISKIACLKNALPQGAPSSPIISNIACHSLDRKLLKFSRKYKSSYSRYADDITFSNCEFEYNNDFHYELKEIIKEEGLEINEEKTRLQKRGFRQEVTGLIVNEKINVRRSYVKEIRSWLYEWERRDFRYAQDKFLIYHTSVHNKGLSLHNYLRGKLDFLKMIRGEKDLVYKKYKNKFEELYFKHSIYHIRSKTIWSFDNNEINELTKNQIIKILNEAIKPEKIKNEIELIKINKKLSKIQKAKNVKSSKKSNTNKSKSAKSNYKDPKKLVKLLNEFNQNPILKHFEHPIDCSSFEKINNKLKSQEFNIEIFLIKAKDSWETLLKKIYPTIRPHKGIDSDKYPLINLINIFIGNDMDKNKAINTNNIFADNELLKVNWSSNELIKWSLTNKGKVPNPDTDLNTEAFIIKPKIKIDGQNNISDYTGLTKYFKSLIRFNSDFPLYKKLNKINTLITYGNEESLKIEIIDKKIFETVDLKICTQRLIRAYKNIIEICKSKNKLEVDKPHNIVVSIKKHKHECTIDIHSKNTILKGDNISWNPGTKTESIISEINGVCDLVLYYKNYEDNNCYKRTLWTKNDNYKNYEKIDKNIEGVIYQLKIHTI